MRGRASCGFLSLVLVLAVVVAAAGDAAAATLAWTKTYNGAANGNDEASGVAVAKDGSVYVTGTVATKTQGPNLVVRKYSSTGGCLWSRIYNGAASGTSDKGSGVAVGPDGSVYVAGSTEAVAGRRAVFLRKYSATGATKWTRIYNRTGTSLEYGNAVAVGKDGSVYVAGQSDADATEGMNVLLLKYTPAGALAWDRTWNSAGNGEEVAEGVAVAPNGSVYVAGWTRANASSGTVLLLCKYGATGNLVWTRTYGATSSLVEGRGVGVDAKGAIYVTGELWTAIRGDDLLLCKYAPTGAVVWARLYDGPSHSGDAGTGVAVAGDGSLWVSGFTVPNAGNANLLLLRYSAAGTRLSTNTWAGASQKTDVGWAVAAGDGSAYVAGSTVAGVQLNNLLLQKYH